MTPAYRDNQSKPVIYARRASTDDESLLESTLEAYEVEELSERDLGRFLAEIVVAQITVGDLWSAARDAAVVEDIYRREPAKMP
jgi:hypothetical protein